MAEIMWVEKYRPKSLSNIVNQESIVSRLKGMLKVKDIPHLLFAGPPGTGKTATILAFAHDFYGETNYRASSLELNASDERGIDVIRNNVKNFARTRGLAEVPFKIIILDEADHLTEEAQHALRRTMEVFAGTCRFCLICNYSSRIIAPIQSRCALFRFTPLSEEDITNRLMSVAKLEGVRLSKEGVNAILKVAEGDMRRAINTLQASASLGKEVNFDSVYDVIGMVKSTDILEMVKLALKGEFVGARDGLRTLLIDRGLSETDILKQIHNVILKSKMKEKWKAKIVGAIGDTDYRISSGADPEIQLSALLANLALIGSEMDNDY